MKISSSTTLLSALTFSTGVAAFCGPKSLGTAPQHPKYPIPALSPIIYSHRSKTILNYARHRNNDGKSQTDLCYAPSTRSEYEMGFSINKLSSKNGEIKRHRELESNKSVEAIEMKGGDSNLFLQISKNTERPLDLASELLAAIGYVAALSVTGIASGATLFFNSVVVGLGEGAKVTQMIESKCADIAIGMKRAKDSFVPADPTSKTGFLFEKRGIVEESSSAIISEGKIYLDRCCDKIQESSDTILHAGSKFAQSFIAELGDNVKENSHLMIDVCTKTTKDFLAVIGDKTEETYRDVSDQGLFVGVGNRVEESFYFIRNKTVKKKSNGPPNSSQEFYSQDVQQCQIVDTTFVSISSAPRKKENKVAHVPPPKGQFYTPFEACNILYHHEMDPTLNKPKAMKIMLDNKYVPVGKSQLYRMLKQFKEGKITDSRQWGRRKAQNLLGLEQC